MSIVALLLLGYLIGSVPFAWLVVRWMRGADLYAAGSSNVGANNAYRTTGSRRIGLVVLALDLLKGVLAVLTGWGLAALLGPVDALGGADRFWPGALTLLGALTGHTYNAFLSRRAGRLVGGKGFATAAGGFLLLMPLLVVVWIGLFLVGVGGFAVWRGVRDVIPGNVLATALIPALAWPLYGGRGALVTALFAVLTLPKHARQLRDLLRRQKSMNGHEAARSSRIVER